MLGRLNLIEMEFFTLIRQHFAMCGIVVSRKTSYSHPFNLKNSKVFILASLFAILAAASLNEANGFDMHTNILFRSFSIGTCGILYEIIVWKTSQLFEFIDSSADIIGSSEY